MDSLLRGVEIRAASSCLLMIISSSNLELASVMETVIWGKFRWKLLRISPRNSTLLAAGMPKRITPSSSIRICLSSLMAAW